MTRMLADLLFLAHVAYILFVVFGALLILVRRRLLWLHVPAVLWAALVEIGGRICPLTPWESRLRTAAGGEGLAGGFLEHYVAPLVYPPGLTREIQIGLGIGVLVLNAALYALILRRGRARRPPETGVRS